MTWFISILKMLGGLVLLVYGMKILSNNLKKISGGGLEKILLSVTNNAFKGLLVGFLITALVQSSAATTVIVVGLVGSGILSLKKSIPIIMGANIGTTVNSQILRLANLSGSSWISLFTPECFAPVLLIVGFLILTKGSKQKTKDIGSLIMGLGLLFTGMMSMMGIAETFSELPILADILQGLSNPFLGVIAGALVTTLVQSSAATIGILQALSTTGMITYASVIPIVLGQNIGTCITSILASVGSNTNAKRVAAVHLFFNLIGTIIFLVVIYSYQTFFGWSFWNNAVDMGRIADFHTLFNIVSTIVIFPFMGLLERLTMAVVKDKKTDDDDTADAEHLVVLNMLDQNVTKIPSIAISNSVAVIDKMAEMSEKNFNRATQIVTKYDSKILEKIQTREDNLDKMEEEITKYLVGLEELDLTKDENRKITSLLSIESEFEKIGDYSFRLSKTAENINEKDIVFSIDAKNELKMMFSIVDEAISKATKAYRNKNLKSNIDIEALKEFTEAKRDELKSLHIKRLKKGDCNVESGIAFIEILNICDSIVNHCLNVSIAVSNYIDDDNIATKHDYRQKMNDSSHKQISNKINYYEKKYSV